MHDSSPALASLRNTSLESNSRLWVYKVKRKVKFPPAAQVVGIKVQDLRGKVGSAGQ